MERALRLATRGSPLALVQARLVAELARTRLGQTCELVVVESSGDLDTVTPISALSGRGVFTTEVDRAVAEGRADLSVHSAKDLPSSSGPSEIELLAIPARGEVRDGLVGGKLMELPPGSTVFTGAIRRRVQLEAARPDLCFSEIRGNIGTRLDKASGRGCLVVAYVALQRLGLTARADEILELETMLPQVGQGAIALCGRADDEFVQMSASKLNDPEAFRAVCAERAFLGRLGGGCDAPVGAYATTTPDGIELRAVVAGRDKALNRGVRFGIDPVAVGEGLADELAAAM